MLVAYIVVLAMHGHTNIKLMTKTWMKFCEQFLIIHEADLRFTEKMPWTDEATFETNKIAN